MKKNNYTWYDADETADLTSFERCKEEAKEEIEGGSEKIYIFKLVAIVSKKESPIEVVEIE